MSDMSDDSLDHDEKIRRIAGLFEDALKMASERAKAGREVTNPLEMLADTLLQLQAADHRLLPDGPMHQAWDEGFQHRWYAMAASRDDNPYPG